MIYYSGRGDKGYTTLFGQPKKLSKSSPVIEALGAVDELNSLLGVCASKSSKQKGILKIIKEVQNHLFLAQAELGGSDKKISENEIKKLEKIIDRIGNTLPKIKTFIMPGGSELSSLLDYARAVARRAERRVAQLKKRGLILKYLNRLSSLLFVLARETNKNKRIKESHPKY